MMRNIIQYELSRDDDNFFYLFLQLYRITSRNVSRDGPHIPKGNILLAHTPHFEFRSQFFLLSFFFFFKFSFSFSLPARGESIPKKTQPTFFRPVQNLQRLRGCPYLLYTNMERNKRISKERSILKQKENGQNKSQQRGFTIQYPGSFPKSV